MSKINTLFLFCLLSVTTVLAQQKEYKGTMRVTPLQLEQRGDSLLIGIDFDISNVNVDSRRSITLIPTLTASDKEIELPVVMVKGRANFLTSKREVALMSRAERVVYEEDAPYAIIKGYNSNDQKQIIYRKTILFEPWMKDARLDIREDLCGCGNAPRSLTVSQLINHVQLEQIVSPYDPTPYLSYIQAKEEAVKRREIESEAFLDFVVSKIDIRPDYMNNPRELKRITDIVEEVRKDSNITVKSISVVGYASPEGALKFNKYLSQGRANALANHILPLFDYPRSMYNIAFGGENWKGLQEVVSRSEMRDKEQVLSVLTDLTIDDEARKDKLSALSEGEPYRFMVNEYYPSLRKAICKIGYEVKSFNVVEAKEVFKTHPQNLSLNEMFMVANTYQSGSPEFINVFETAVKIYPEDKISNLNAANAALSCKNKTLAEQYLNKIVDGGSIPEYHNALGVLMMLKGEYIEAERHLSIAAKSGLESAQKNLIELKKQKENTNSK